jgi:hypothetical protein
VGLRLEAIDFGAVPWQELDAMPDRTVFQTREWLLFVQATQKATPVVAALRDGSDTVGYFTGLVARKLGIKVLGSPFPGWTTSYMGFNLRPGVVRREAMAALPDFAFEQLRCMHLEFMDRQCTPEDYRALGWEYRMIGTFEVDLTADEETIFRRMKQGSCRWSIRKAAKSGVVIAEASDDAFAEEYYAMLQEVFAKQGLVPTYGLGPGAPPDSPHVLDGAAPVAPGAVSGRGLHRHRHIPGLQHDHDVLGRGQLAAVPEVPAQRGCHLACHALLEGARYADVRHVRRRRVQAKVRRAADRRSVGQAVAVPHFLPGTPRGREGLLVAVETPGAPSQQGRRRRP